MTPTNILVVDDEKIIAKGIEKRLKGMGYAVAGLIATGEQAVELAMEHPPDLVLMDINLGAGMDGIEAANLIRRRANVPVVFLTAHSDNATLQRAKLTEPFGFISKPYEDKDLQTAIEIGLYKHKMERRLRENEQWLAATLGSIDEGVIATDEKGRVRFLNALAERLTGWTQADALGRDVREVLHIVDEKTREPVPNPALQALEKGEPVTLSDDTILIDKGARERPIDDSAAPIRDVNGRMSGAVLVFRDITERRRLEEHLRQALKMEAIGRLAGGIAHDFNNIMTIITGFCELLLGDGLSAADRRDAVTQIHDAGNRAAALTQQIMAFSRKQVLMPCVLNLNGVVRDMAALVKRLIGSNIDIVSRPAADLGVVKADPTQIGQVLLNLAANARDAMPGGGRLTVETANVEVGAGAAGVPPGRYAVLSVADTGTGIPPDVLPRIFEPFYTTKGVGRGTGLGLATVFGIVEQSGGRIAVDSQVGVGTTFRVYLPRVDDPAPGLTVGPTLLPSTGVETVLLVEDEETVRQLTRTILERVGYRVLEAADGRAAVAIADAHVGPIHLLLTDLMMPHLSGREVAERLLPTRPEMRAVFMSGYTEDAVLRLGVESESLDFLHKPFTLHSLTAKVREVLDRP